MPVLSIGKYFRRRNSALTYRAAEYAARWVLGTSPRMTKEGNAPAPDNVCSHVPLRPIRPLTHLGEHLPVLRRFQPEPLADRGGFDAKKGIGLELQVDPRR